MNIGDLLEFQRAFESQGERRSATEIEYLVGRRQGARSDEFAVVFSVHCLFKLCRQVAKGIHQPRLTGLGQGAASLGPTRMANADRTRQRLAREPRLEVHELALGAASVNATIYERGDPCGIVSAIFKPFQPIDEQGRNGHPANDTDDATHGCCL